MAHWNYRIVRYADGTGCALHSVNYDDDGNPTSMSRLPSLFAGDTPQDVRKQLIIAIADAKLREVFDEPDEWIV